MEVLKPLEGRCLRRPDAVKTPFSMKNVPERRNRPAVAGFFGVNPTQQRESRLLSRC